MEPCLMKTKVPFRWRVAARVNQLLPQVRGRFRIVDAISGPHHADAVTTVHLAPDLTFEAELNTSAHLFFLQYIPLSLGPLFDGVLRPGDFAIDVGANEGLYTDRKSTRLNSSHLGIS